MPCIPRSSPHPRLRASALGPYHMAAAVLIASASRTISVSSDAARPRAAMVFVLLIADDAHRHADLDRARPDGAYLPVHADRSADRRGGAEAVHRHREVRDHGDPVLYPRRQFPDARRRREAHDRVRHSLVGHWHGGLALAGILACAMFALVCGSTSATVVAIGSIILPAMVSRVSPALRRRRHHRRRLARHSDAAVDPEGDLRDFDQRLDRRIVCRGPVPGHALTTMLCPSPGTSRAKTLSAHGEGPGR